MREGVEEVLMRIRLGESPHLSEALCCMYRSGEMNTIWQLCQEYSPSELTLLGKFACCGPSCQISPPLPPPPPGPSPVLPPPAVQPPAPLPTAPVASCGIPGGNANA